MKSKYGERETVGTTYLDSQKNSTEGLTLGEINTEMVSDLVDEINKSIASDPFEGKSFYINIVEERDLQMKNAFKRRKFVSQYRPYPEDNTLVFHVNPKESRVKYCWDLPHHSELPNILSNEHLYDHDYTQRIKEWLRNDLSNFGFVRVSMDSSQVRDYDEKIINAYKEAYYNYCKTQDMDEKSVETEQKLGFFWIPAKNPSDHDMEKKASKIQIIGA